MTASADLSAEPEERRRVAWLEHPRVARLVALSLAFVVLFSGTGTAPLSSTDSALHAGLARRMLETQEWAMPILYGHAWVEHLPLFLWTSALGQAVLGLTPLGARAASLGFAWCTVWLTFEIANRRRGLLAGAIATVALLTTEIFWRYAARVRPDMPLLFFTALAVFSLDLAEQNRRWLVLFGLATGGAIFSKGPVGLFVLFAFVGREIAVRHNPPSSFLRSPWLIVGGVVALLGPLLWILILSPDHRAIFFDRFVKHQTLSLPLDASTSGRDFFFVPRTLARTYWPWLVPLVASLWLFVRDTSEKRARLIPIWAWAGGIVAVLTLAAHKPEYYLLPVYPAFSVLIGDAVARALVSKKAQKTVVGALAGATVLIATGLMLSPMNIRLGHLEQETERIGALVPAIADAMKKKPDAALAIFGPSPDRIEWALNLHLDLERAPARVAPKDVNEFLKLPDHLALGPEDDANLAGGARQLAGKEGWVLLGHEGQSTP